MMLRVYDTDKYTANKKLLDSNVNLEFVKQPLNRFYNKQRLYIDSPQVASGKLLKKLAGSAAGSLIDSVRAASKGKVVYIDFWATWCGPCKQQMPYSNRLEHKYAGKDVKFVYVCVASDKKAWQSEKNRQMLSGSQVYCDKRQSASLVSQLAPSLPCYMLINKNGDITEHGTTRPADPLTAIKINKLLSF